MKNKKISTLEHKCYRSLLFSSRKAMELPVNIVVMLIIGLIIFGLGMALFNKISGSAEGEIADLNNQIKNDIANLQCQGDDWVCAPSSTMKNGDKKTFNVYVANRGQENAKFTVKFNNLDSEGKVVKDECGSVQISYPNIETNIMSGKSGSFPFIVRANRVTKTPCSFVTTVTLSSDGEGEGKKTPVIIRIE